MWFRKLLCRAFGHRSICLLRWYTKHLDTANPSEYTCWKCERCLTTFVEQWDA